MTARLTRSDEVVQLDRPAEPPENVTEEDVQDAGKVARLLMRLLRDVTGLKRRFWPRAIDFEDRDVDDTGTTKYRFTHNFGGRVRWWVVDAVDTSGGPAYLARHADTDNDTLVLVSFALSRVTIRVEEAG